MVESLPFLLKGGVWDPGAGPSELAIEALSKPSTVQTRKVKVTEGWKTKWYSTAKLLHYQIATGCVWVHVFSVPEGSQRAFHCSSRSQASPHVS